MRSALFDRLLRYGHWATTVAAIGVSWWHTYHHRSLGRWSAVMMIGLCLLAVARHRLGTLRQSREQVREPFL